MLGDSFCKSRTRPSTSDLCCSTFNPHAWGLFLQDGHASQLWGFDPTFNPHAWGLFLQELDSIRRRVEEADLSIPMLGDSFCKHEPHHVGRSQPHGAFNPHAWGLFLQGEKSRGSADARDPAFNPHAWGLFLQDSVVRRWRSHARDLSIPMLGDSFCKSSRSYPRPINILTFNPHAWGLFLQVIP